MNKIIKYRVATAEGNVNDLIQSVNRLIEEGFQPYGGVSSTVIAPPVVGYAQAMVKFSKTDDGKFKIKGTTIA